MFPFRRHLPSHDGVLSQGSAAAGAAVPGDGLSLLGDHPYLGDDDPLDFTGIARDLSSLVLFSRNSTPFTLGIEGGWGKGKSTLMRKLEKELAAQPGLTTIWFNAWTSDHGTALEGLIKSVLAQLDSNILRRAARNQRMVSWLRLMTAAVGGWLKLGSLTNTLWERIDLDPKARNDARDLIVDAMRQWTQSDIGTSGRLLVVFVDDVDRCSPETVMQVFETIKLYLDAPGFVFVIGYDREIVSDSILSSRSYPKGYQYAEKIIQIAYRIPATGDQQVHRLIDLYLELSKTANVFDKSVRSLVIDQNSRNPRRIKRFINGFVLEYGLDPEWRDIGAETLVRVLVLDLYFAEFASLLRSQSPRDPLDDFLSYVHAHYILRSRIADESREAFMQLSQFAEGLGLRVPPVGALRHDELLRELEQELPEVFPQLVRDHDLVTLLQDLRDAANWPSVREKLRAYVPVAQIGGDDREDPGLKDEEDDDDDAIPAIECPKCGRENLRAEWDGLTPCYACGEFLGPR